MGIEFVTGGVELVERPDAPAFQHEALARATGCRSMENMVAVLEHFGNTRGLGYDSVEPGKNVLTFHAWRAVGRHVKRGEKGFRVETWVPRVERVRLPDGTESAQSRQMHSRAFVFHISQTEPDGGTAPAPVPAPESLPQGKPKRARRSRKAGAV